jgi:hypothetical protein
MICEEFEMMETDFLEKALFRVGVHIFQSHFFQSEQTCKALHSLGLFPP